MDRYELLTAEEVEIIFVKQYVEAFECTEEWAKEVMEMEYPNLLSISEIDSAITSMRRLCGV